MSTFIVMRPGRYLDMGSRLHALCKKAKGCSCRSVAVGQGATNGSYLTTLGLGYLSNLFFIGHPNPILCSLVSGSSLSVAT
ncbi:MAG: hypothetical protein WCR46_07385 [Deltaproteobacteria bacterium]